MQQTLNDSSDFSFSRCCGCVVKLLILAAVAYACKYTYDTFKEKPQFHDPHLQKKVNAIAGGR